jgi:hypothetical protein
MEASYKPRERRILNTTAHTDRGQLFVSVRFMAEAWDWSKSTVDRFLKRLEKRDIIKIESGTGGNIITVCDYDEIQNTPNYNGTASGHDAGQQRDTGGTAAGQQRDKPNIDSIPDEIQGGDGASAPTQQLALAVPSQPTSSPKASPRGTRLPDDWQLPKDWGDWAVAEGWSVDAVRSEAEKFKDYWIAKPGAPGRKADWKATWRNWMRNCRTPKMEAVDDNGNISPHNPRRGPAGGNVHQAQADAFLDAALRRRS